jgi:hypothetical protein
MFYNSNPKEEFRITAEQDRGRALKPSESERQAGRKIVTERFKRGDSFSFPSFGYDQDKACVYSGGQDGTGTSVCKYVGVPLSVLSH